MRASLDRAIAAILAHEGGYSNHPSDKGGETMHGIVKATARAHGYFGKMKDLPKAVANRIYRDTYWRAVNADNLPAGIDLAVFDHGVNAGPVRAVKLLQNLVGAAPDGNCGPVTVAACWRRPDFLELIGDYGDARLRYYRSLNTWGTFGRGWARRVKGTQAIAVGLAEQALAAKREAVQEPEPAGMRAETDSADTSGTGLDA